jgi:soluble lytic murein transglycosylase
LAAAFFVLTAAHLYVSFSYPLKYKNYVKEYSQEFGIDEATIFSIIRAESSFNPQAVSKSGAIGLMQVMPSTALMLAGELNIEGFNTDMLYEPQINIRLGVFYYKKMLEKFGGRETALAAYNAGEGNVSSWLQNAAYTKDGKNLSHIPFKETSDYVKKINKNYRIYKVRVY